MKWFVFRFCFFLGFFCLKPKSSFFKRRQLIVNDLHSSKTVVVSLAMSVYLSRVRTDISVIVVSEREITRTGKLYFTSIVVWIQTKPVFAIHSVLCTQAHAHFHLQTI